MRERAHKHQYVKNTLNQIKYGQFRFVVAAVVVAVNGKAAYDDDALTSVI